MSSSPLYTRHHPFYSAVKERYSLTRPGSKKDTQHVVLDLTGSDISYEVGDCVGILPVNPPEYVEKTLEAFGTKGDQLLTFRQEPEKISFRHLLENYLNLSSIPKKLIEMIAAHHPQLNELLDHTHKQELKQFQSEREVWDFLYEHRLPEPDPQSLVDILQPLLPRFYSIASHQPSVGNEIHLTVAHLHYLTLGYNRYGVCTHYLCALAPINDWSVPLYLQPHKGFTLTDNPETDIIMIGPGTGIAPYRGFMQKRVWREDSGRSWLFFGEWHADTEFYYEDFWKPLEQEGKLRISTAFSRDQEHKIYVHHRMLEHADELYRWIENGAVIYVCGDAVHMAKDVEATLLTILTEKGHMKPANAAEYLKLLRHEKRYLRDVY